jgi:hypothetical protein
MTFTITIPPAALLIGFFVLLILISIWMGKTKWFDHFINNFINKIIEINEEKKEYGTEKRGK